MAKEGNNGNNDCKKSGNAKSCENNPNTIPEEIICLDCLDTYWDSINSCNDDRTCGGAAYTTVIECFEKFHESTG